MDDKKVDKKQYKLSFLSFDFCLICRPFSSSLHVHLSIFSRQLLLLAFTAVYFISVDIYIVSISICRHFCLSKLPLVDIVMCWLSICQHLYVLTLPYVDIYLCWLNHLSTNPSIDSDIYWPLSTFILVDLFICRPNHPILWGRRRNGI